MITIPFAAIIFASAAGLCGCVHTPRGTSVQLALARRAELVQLPPSAKPIAAAQPVTPRSTESLAPDRSERVAEAFSRGQFCMGVGNNQEAIGAFEEVVKLDPHFSDAWQRLAALYEKGGDEKKAMESFRKAKMVADAGSMR